jgi:hypothetical protein
MNDDLQPPAVRIGLFGIGLDTYWGKIEKLGKL